MKPLTGWRLLAQKFVRDRSALSGLIITAALAPYLAPFPADQGSTEPKAPNDDRFDATPAVTSGLPHVGRDL